MDKNEIIQKLRKHLPEIRKYGVERIALFGSHVLGTARPDSDIDLYVAFREGETTFDNFMELYEYLENLFPGVKVEVVTEDGVSPYIEPDIKRTAEYV